MCVMLCGATFFSYFTGTIISMVAAADRKHVEYRELMNKLVNFLAERQKYLVIDTRARVTKQMAYEWGKGRELVNQQVSVTVT